MACPGTAEDGPWNWGGGLVQTGATTWTASHIYAELGRYVIQATATEALTGESITDWDVFVPGQLDKRFGDDGRVLEGFDTTATSWGRKLLVQPDGKIVVVGYDNNDFALARFLPTGRLT